MSIFCEVEPPVPRACGALVTREHNAPRSGDPAGREEARRYKTGGAWPVGFPACQAPPQIRDRGVGPARQCEPAPNTPEPRTEVQASARKSGAMLLYLAATPVQESARKCH